MAATHEPRSENLLSDRQRNRWLFHATLVGINGAMWCLSRSQRTRLCGQLNLERNVQCGQPVACVFSPVSVALTLNCNDPQEEYFFIVRAISMEPGILYRQFVRLHWSPLDLSTFTDLFSFLSGRLKTVSSSTLLGVSIMIAKQADPVRLVMFPIFLSH